MKKKFSSYAATRQKTQEMNCSAATRPKWGKRGGCSIANKDGKKGGFWRHNSGRGATIRQKPRNAGCWLDKWTQTPYLCTSDFLKPTKTQKYSEFADYDAIERVLTTHRTRRTSSQPAVPAVLIAPSGADSPGSAVRN